MGRRRHRANDIEWRFASYVEGLVSVIGHQLSTHIFSSPFARRTALDRPCFGLPASAAPTGWRGRTISRPMSPRPAATLEQTPSTTQKTTGLPLFEIRRRQILCTANRQLIAVVIYPLAESRCGRSHRQISFSLFNHLRLAKADTFSAAVILDELNSSDLKRAANCCFIGECNWNFPVNDLGPTDRSHPYL
jgi:hypothetical protein